MNRLPYDFARCEGVGNDVEGWREGCETCLRRTSQGRKKYQAYLIPDDIIAFECVYLIEPKGESK